MTEKNQGYSDSIENPPSTNTGARVEAYKDVERFKLSIWIAKAFSTFVLAVGGIVITSYIYLTIINHQAADLTAVGSFLGGFFDVIKVVVSE